MSLRSISLYSVAVWAAWMIAACDKPAGNSKSQSMAASKSSQGETAPTPSEKKPALPAQTNTETSANVNGEGANGKPTATVASKQHVLELMELGLTIPSGWIREKVTPGPMAPVASFLVPAAEKDSDPFRVRITYYPMMKGKDDLNIKRWVGQVKRPDGTASSLKDAKVEVIEEGSIRLKIVDITGTINTRMGGGGEGNAGQRMIAAIVDHPAGPHFVKAVGPLAAMEKRASDVYTFIKSAKGR